MTVLNVSVPPIMLLSSSTCCVARLRNVRFHSLRRFSILLLISVLLETKLTISLLTSLLLVTVDRKSGSAGMPRPISYAVFCLGKREEGPPRPTFPPPRQRARARGQRVRGGD